MNYDASITPIHPDLTGYKIYRLRKTYDHDEGLSCCFRQWRATHSHCKFVHGYALAFYIEFATAESEQYKWCTDFNGLEPIMGWIKHMFEHTMLVARDDPELLRFELLARKGLIDLRVVPAVGCEATAEYTYNFVRHFLDEQTGGKVWVESVEVKEHGGNSAIYCL